MRPRHPLPRRWMMTDERLGDMAAKVAKLPRGSGVVFRQYATPEGKRRRMFAQVRRIARARRLTLLIAGPFLPGADGVHGKKARKNNGLATRPVHSVRERIAAERAGVDATFVSPVFATRSHPGARPLGRIRFAMLIRGARLPVIALGGMTERRARTLPGIAGWAAIDAWSAPRPTAERS